MVRAILLILAVVFLAAAPFFGDAVMIQYGIDALLFATLAQAWNILGGFTGYASFGNSAFYGLGTYGTAIAMAQLHLPFWVGLSLGAFLAVLCAVVIGLPILRLRGHYFAIVDEVDSILIDEARTPLIISGPAVHTFDEQYAQWKPTVVGLVRAQQQLCNRFLKEAEELIKKLHPADGSQVKNADELEKQIGLLLFRVKCGQPRSEALMKFVANKGLSVDVPPGPLPN